MSGKSYFSSDVPEMVIKSLFAKYDTDGSGRLGKSELLSLLKDDLGFDDKAAQACIMLVDKDGSGAVSREEFTGWLRSGDGFKNIDDSSRYFILQKAITYFKQFDKDNSGAIDNLNEFKDLMISVGVVDESRFESCLRALDTSGDGKISFTEFLDWLKWLPKS